MVGIEPEILWMPCRCYNRPFPKQLNCLLLSQTLSIPDWQQHSRISGFPIGLCLRPWVEMWAFEPESFHQLRPNSKHTKLLSTKSDYYGLIWLVEFSSDEYLSHHRPSENLWPELLEHHSCSSSRWPLGLGFGPHTDHATVLLALYTQNCQIFKHPCSWWKASQPPRPKLPSCSQRHS